MSSVLNRREIDEILRVLGIIDDEEIRVGVILSDEEIDECLNDIDEYINAKYNYEEFKEFERFNLLNINQNREY